MTKLLLLQDESQYIKTLRSGPFQYLDCPNLDSFIIRCSQKGSIVAAELIAEKRCEMKSKIYNDDSPAQSERSLCGS